MLKWIKKVDETSRYTYGGRRMRKALNALGYPVGIKSIRQFTGFNIMVLVDGQMDLALFDSSYFSRCDQTVSDLWNLSLSREYHRLVFLSFDIEIL